MHTSLAGHMALRQDQAVPAGYYVSIEARRVTTGLATVPSRTVYSTSNILSERPAGKAKLDGRKHFAQAWLWN